VCVSLEWITRLIAGTEASVWGRKLNSRWGSNLTFFGFQTKGCTLCQCGKACSWAGKDFAREKMNFYGVVWLVVIRHLSTVASELSHILRISSEVELKWLDDQSKWLKAAPGFLQCIDCHYHNCCMLEWCRSQQRGWKACWRQGYHCSGGLT